MEPDMSDVSIVPTQPEPPLAEPPPSAVPVNVPPRRRNRLAEVLRPMSPHELEAP